MTRTLLHPYITNRPELCDGCGDTVPACTIVYGRFDGVIFCEPACEARHPDAKAPESLLLALAGSLI